MTIVFLRMNCGGAIFDRLAYTGGALLINGTAVVTVCTKQHTAYNTTEAELEAATKMGKRVQWLRIFLEDIGLSCDQPIFIGEDNLALKTIAHAGKLTCTVRHIATKTSALQEQVRFWLVVFGSVSTTNNLADHFTKPLPFKSHRSHCQTIMGLGFIDQAHCRAT